MSRFYRRFKQPIDQLAHIAAGFALALPAALFGLPWLGVGYAVAFAMYREFVKQRPVNSWADTLIDLAFWCAGAAGVLLI